MESFNFSKVKIDDHMEKVGVDIRPVFEPKLDYGKFYEIGKELRDEFPALFESLVQSPSDFRIMKKFFFPGNAEAEVPTLTTTQRGIVFTFPRRISALNEEVEINKIDDIVVQCLNRLRRAFPHKNIIRVGLVNEYIYDTADIDAGQLICQRFMKFPTPPGGDVQLKVNLRLDDYNRTIEMVPVHKIQPVPEIPGQSQSIGHGLRVKTDFNNIDMSKNLEQAQIYTIIHEGQRFNEKDLYGFLNNTKGEEE